jgi:hypothetical protein
MPSTKKKKSANYMTDQEPDIMHENGVSVVPLGYPLEYYFEKHQRPPFQFRKTSCHRGYVVTWEIKDKSLYLVSIEGILEGEKKASVADVFPGRSPPILADFINGDIAIGRGKVTRQGWNFIYEHEELLTLKAGKIVGRKPFKRQ